MFSSGIANAAQRRTIVYTRKHATGSATGRRVYKGSVDSMNKVEEFNKKGIKIDSVEKNYETITIK